MKKLFQRIRQNWYFLLFILLFAYIQSIYSRIAVRGEVNLYTFTPEAAFAKLFSMGILFLIIGYFIRYWQKSATLNAKEMLKIFGSSTLVFVLFMQLSGLLISILFGNLERNFNLETIVLSTFRYLLDGMIYGSFFLAYFYHRKNKQHQEQMVRYHQALSDSRINQLKTQLNPHFLFNNLNVLDQLIEEDKQQASDFLNEFAEIYRYVLQASDKTLVSLTEELAFAKQYFRLIRHKYGDAYRLSIEHQGGSNGYVVPLTLQLLIENAVQHNLGTVEHPVWIRVEVTTQLDVSNNLISKRNTKTVSGRALKNLEEQYKLLTNSPIGVHQSNNVFLVQIPLIQEK